MRGPIDASIGPRIEAEFSLPSLKQVTHSYETRAAGPEPVLRKLVDVFIDDGAHCPGFQVVPGSLLDPVVVGLFERALTLKVPHNYVAAWMLTPPTDLVGSRPVDLRHEAARLHAGLETLA